VKTYPQWLNVMLLLALLLPIAGHPTAAALSEDIPTTPQVAAPVAASVDETLRNSPVMFIENVGQFEERDFGASSRPNAATDPNLRLHAPRTEDQVTLLSDPTGDHRASSTVQSENVALMAQIGGTVTAVVVQGTYAYVGEGPRLVILDIADPASPTVVGKTHPLSILVDHVAVGGDYAYVISERNSSLHVIDVSDPTNPIEVAFHDTSVLTQGLYVSDGMVYIVGLSGNLLVMDASDPTNPTEVGYYQMPGLAHNIYVDDNIAYIADSDYGLRMVDVSDPTNPLEVGLHNTPGQAVDVYVNNSIAYVADLSGGLRVVDVSDPTDSTEVGYLFVPSYAMNVHVDNDVAYVTPRWSRSVWIVDVTDPTKPTSVGRCGSADVGSLGPVYVSSSIAYVPEGIGLRLVDVSDPTRPTEVGYYDTAVIASNVYVNGGIAYVASGNLGLRMIDVSDPTNPIVVGHHDTPGQAVDVYVNNSIAYIADFTGGLRVIDVSNPAQPEELGACETMTRTVGIYVSGNLAYVVDRIGGLRVVDVGNSSNPMEIGYYDTPGGVYGVFVSGSIAYVAGASGGLRVVDMSNPTAPREIGYYRYYYSGSPENKVFAHCVYVNNNIAYVGDAWFGLYVVDVSVPADPVGLGHMGGTVVDVYVSDKVAYVANRNWGLRVVDVSNPSNPTEIGYYDTPGKTLGVFVNDSTAYLADYAGGFLILRYTGTMPDPNFAVVTTEPADGVTGIPTNTLEITARFSEPVYPPSLNELTMILWDGVSRVPGIVEYRSSDNTAVLKPDSLAPGTRYLVMLRPDIVAADDQTQHLELYGWWFTTEGSERDRLIQALEDLKMALINKITYDAQILSIDFTLARELHKQKTLLDFLSLSSDVFLLWAGKDAGALFGPLSEFTDMVGKVGLAAKTAGLVEDAQAMDARLWEIVRIADQAYGGDPLEGEDFDTSGYRSYFQDAVMGSHSPVNSIPLLYGPIGYTPSILARTNAYGIQFRIASQFDTLIEELPNPLPSGLDVEGLIADINEVTRGVRRSQQREEEVRYSAYFPGHGELFPQSHWLGVIAEDSKMTSRIASDAANSIKEEAEFTVMKTSMAGTKLILLIASTGGAATAEAVYQLVDVAILPGGIRDIKNEFERINPHVLLDQHVYRMVMHYGLETATVWRIANEMALSVDHRVRYPYMTTKVKLNVAAEFTVSGLELQDIELTDAASIGEGIGVITVSNTSAAPLRARLTGYIDTPIAGSAETSIISVFGSELPRDIAPGATEVLTFTYTVFSSNRFGVQGYHAQALLHIINLNTLEHNIHGPIEAHFFVGKDSTLETMTMQQVYVPLSGTLAIGQVHTQTVTLQPTTQRLRLQLVQDFRSDFDLHLYDALGRHVGYNYSNATTETAVPGSSYSGRDVRAEWIEIAPITSSLQFVVEVVAINSDSAANYSVVALETPALPVVVSVFPENLVHQTRAPTTTIQFAVREIGKQSDLTEITLLASDLRSNSVDDLIPFANIGFTLPVTTVMAGGELYITGTITLPDNLAEANYTGTVTVQGQDSSTMTPVTTTMQLTLVYVQPKQIYLPLVLRQS